MAESFDGGLEIGLANRYIYNHEWSKAEDALRRIVRACSTADAVRLSEPLSHVQLKLAYVCMMQHKWAEAAALYAINNEDGRWDYRILECLCCQGKFAEALPLAEKLLEKDRDEDEQHLFSPGYLPLHRTRLELLCALSRFDEARRLSLLILALPEHASRWTVFGARPAGPGVDT